jgi:catechol 2,3-dioxygenase-like lactoylglutathione lyase family enzyme
MPIHHISIPVRDVGASKAFYTAVLQSLTYGVYKDLGNSVGFAPPGGRADFWIHASPETGRDEKQESNPKVVTHVAFAGKSEKDVEDFHAAAL